MRPQISIDAVDLSNEFRRAVHAGAEARYLHRLHCVVLVKAGCQAAQVADWYQRPVRTIERWCRQYALEGPEGLVDKPRQGRPATLSPEEMTELADKVARSPRSSGLEARAWTGVLIREYLQQNLDIDLSLRQSQRLLKRLQQQE